MNELATTSATLPANASGSRSPLPTPWVERLFSRLEALYGAKFHDNWRGTDLQNVKAVWAEKLAGFADMPDCLRLALDACDEKPWPPTLPEFLSMCRDAARRIGTARTPAIEHKLSLEDIALNRARIKAMAEGLAKAKEPK